MYRHLSQFVVKTADLAEAEGRVLRRMVGRLGVGLTVALAGAGLLLAGALMLLLAVWLALSQGMDMSRAAASAITGAMALGLAGIAYAVVARLVK
ncbi:MAG TPA: hypothetical protein PKE29_11000 [Phycisphaerales bacterium]|nr:hypothetical protein [Phycisphaerales bacterium]